MAPNPRRRACPVASRAAALVLSLRDISTLGDRGVPALHDLSLELHGGEVFGIAGVDGNGQKELGEVIAGQRPVTSGQVLFDGVDITNRGVAAATRLGIGYVTDDRLHEGSVAGSSITDNVALKSIGRKPFSNGFWLNRRAMDDYARRLIAEFDVKTPGPDTAIGMLSGGNIQKLLLARELALDPKLLVCNKPTTGLDLRTARFVLQSLREQADAGKVVVLISSELDELMEISDRIGVMYNGQLVADHAACRGGPGGARRPDARRGETLATGASVMRSGLVPSRFAPLLTSLAAIAAAMILGGVFLAMRGKDPVAAYGMLFSRGLGTSYGITEMLIRMAPLADRQRGAAHLAASRRLEHRDRWAAAWSARCSPGVAAAAVAGQVANPVMWVVAGLAGMGGGLLWALVPGILRVRWGLNEIITTLMMNYVALNVTSWLVKGPVKDPEVVPPADRPHSPRTASAGASPALASTSVSCSGSSSWCW